MQGSIAACSIVDTAIWGVILRTWELAKMRISVFGLGYVGTVSAVSFTKMGHSVIGVDVKDEKVKLINAGQSPIIEPGVQELLTKAKGKGLICATCDVEKAIFETEISLLCVGTPSNRRGALELRYLENVTGEIAEMLKAKKSFHIIVVRSTVLPGTIEYLARHIEVISGLKGNIDFGIASNPEFLREGTAVSDFEDPPFTVIGTEDERVSVAMRELYRGISAPFHVVKVREAELLKYACNSFHAVKVAFANEIGSISKSLGIDSHVVMDIFCEDKKLNISPYYLKPGFAFGGSCLPKDVRALCAKSMELGIESPLLKSVLPSNQLTIQRLIQDIISTGRKEVGFLGLTFKPATDDTRESPIVDVVETLIGKGYNVSIFDPNIELSKLLGTNKSFLEQEIPHIAKVLTESVDELIVKSEIVVLTNKSKEFHNIATRLTKGHILFDLARMDGLDGNEREYEYHGISW